ncbi:MAG: hypothetical protein WD066_01730 [Planctomycetaceae bacterium]
MLTTFTSAPSQASRALVRFMAPAAMIGLLAADSASAQQVTVQQPVVATMGVRTTVGVPDRGGVFLGGVSRAASSRNTFGPYPFRAGSSVGRESQSSGISAHVRIHDLAAMDEYLLGVDTGRTPPQSRPATTARGELMRRNFDRPGLASSGPVGISPAASAARVAVPSITPAGLRDAASPAEGHHRLGLRAEARGDAAVARIHFRMAAERGSEAARAKLAEFDRSTAAPVAVTDPAEEPSAVHP